MALEEGASDAEFENDLEQMCSLASEVLAHGTPDERSSASDDSDATDD